MSQLNSNQLGEILLKLGFDSAQVDAALNTVEGRAQRIGEKVETVGKKGEDGFKKMAGEALGTAAALGSVIAAVDRVLKAVDEANKASENWANTFRELDRDAASIAQNFTDQPELFDRLRKQIATLGDERIRQIDRERDSMDALSLIYGAFLNLLGSSRDEAADFQIQQIESRRKQLEASLKAAETERGIANLEKAANDSRRSQLTADERRVEDLQAKIKDGMRLLEQDNGTANGLRLLSAIDQFDKEINAIMSKAGEAAAKSFGDVIEKRFAGVFGEGGLRDFGVSLQTQLQAIESQIRSAGSLRGGV